MAKFTDTTLKLSEDASCADGVMQVPSLTIPGTSGKPFYTTSEVMVFRVKDSKGKGVRLKVAVRTGIKSATVTSVARFDGRAGVEIEARRLTILEKAGLLAKPAMGVALVAFFLAFSAGVTLFVLPSGDEKAARVEFARQLDPIETQLDSAIKAHDQAGIQRAQDSLKAALAKPNRSSWVSVAVKWGTFLLGVLSAGIAIFIAFETAKTTPD